MHVRWLTAFLDFPAADFGSEVTFWRAISGSTVSMPRGASKEFASLDPFNGDAHLRVQRIGSAPAERIWTSRWTIRPPRRSKR